MIPAIFYLGWILLGAGSAGTIFAVAMEMYAHEPKWMIIMKITSALFGVGGALIGIGGII